MTTAKTEKIGDIAIRPLVRNGTQTKSWQLDIPPHLTETRKRQRKSFKSKSAAQTEARRITRMFSIKSQFNSPSLMKTMTFSECSEIWFNEQITLANTGHKRKKSVETVSYYLKTLLSNFAIFDLHDISSQSVLEYQEKRKEKGVKAATINSETNTLKQVLNWAHEEGICQKMPKVRSLPIEQKHIDLPTPEEIAKIAQHMSAEDGIVFRFLAETGCRKSEAFGMAWQDIDIENNIVHIRPDEEREHYAKNTSSYRSIPISAKLMSDISNRGKTSSLLFPGRGGKQRDNMKKAIKRAIEAADIQRNGKYLHLTHHMIRKAHATWHAMRGTPEPLLQARLGHVPGSRVTNKVYVKVSQEAAKSGVIEI